MTINSLDFGDDEEAKDVPTLDSGLKNVTAELDEYGLTPSVSRSSVDSRFDDTLVNQIKAAFNKYKNRTDEEEGEEFETRH